MSSEYLTGIILSTLIAKKPTPLLNTPHFDQVFGGKTIPLDEKGLLRPLEMIALPETTFEILEQMSPHIFKVTTQDYPHGPVYIDHRFTFESNNSPPRKKVLPSKDQILTHLENALGLPYIWGGNWSQGIPEIEELYNPHIPKNLHSIWTLKGLDCSGLLYEATNGYTPRNTSDLLTFGKQVSDVKPLDILVFEGHVIVCFSSTHTIESLYGKGVILTPLDEKIKQLSSTNFVIRRFV